MGHKVAVCVCVIYKQGSFHYPQTWPDGGEGCFVTALCLLACCRNQSSKGFRHSAHAQEPRGKGSAQLTAPAKARRLPQLKMWEEPCFNISHINLRATPLNPFPQLSKTGNFICPPRTHDAALAGLAGAKWYGGGDQLEQNTRIGSSFLYQLFSCFLFPPWYKRDK